MRKHSMFLAVSLVLAFACTMLNASPATASSATPWNVSTFNIAGYARGGGGSQSAATSAVIYWALGESPRPYGILVQEVCNAQYERLRDTLDDYGYFPIRSLTRSSTLSGEGVAGTGEVNSTSCPHYGNAMFIAGGSPVQATCPSTRDSFSCERWLSTGATQIEPRKLECKEATSLAGLHTMCNTHTDGNRAATHVAQYLDIVMAYFGSTTPVAGGDFNRDWVNVATASPSFNNAFWEADGGFPPGYTALSSPNPTVKFDYIFGGKYFFYEWRSADRWCPANSESDHCYVFGHLARFLP